MAKRDYAKDSRLRASDELRQTLIQRKRPGDSYEDVIWRLLDQQEELEELLQEWRTKANAKYGVSGLLCADELQDVLEGDV